MAWRASASERARQAGKAKSQASQPASQPASREASQPASQPAGQSQPASKPKKSKQRQAKAGAKTSAATGPQGSRHCAAGADKPCEPTTREQAGRRARPQARGWLGSCRLDPLFQNRECASLSLSELLDCFVAFSRGSEGSYPRAKGRLIHDQAMLAGNPPPLRSTRVRLARAFATTTKIRTSGGSRPARAVSFYAHHRALLLAGASRPPRRSL